MQRVAGLLAALREVQLAMQALAGLDKGIGGLVVGEAPLGSELLHAARDGGVLLAGGVGGELRVGQRVLRRRGGERAIGGRGVG